MALQISDGLHLLKTGWRFIQLPGYRDFKELSSYETFNFQELPPLSEKLDGNFEWLKRQTQKFHHSIGQVEFLQNEAEERIDFLNDDASKLLQYMDAAGQALPQEFIKLITSEELYNRIRSCTHCHFELTVRPAKAIGKLRGLLIKFLTDSQASPNWHLFLDAAGNHCVLESPRSYGYNSYDAGGWANQLDDEEVDLLEEDIRLCAYSFEEFMYRFWIENEIWYALNSEHTPLTEQQKKYLEHYRHLKN